MIVKKLHKQISQIIKTGFLCAILFGTNNIQPGAFDDDEFDSLLGNITEEKIKALQNCAPGEAAVWNNFLTTLGVPQTLNNQFYIKTSLPRTRNIMNYPEFQLCSYQDMDSKSQLTFHLFYNQTSRKNYTQSVGRIDGTRIGSYLNIEDKNFISLIDAGLRTIPLPPDLQPLQSLNYPILLNDLANARLEERRLGFLSHYYHKIDKNTYFEFKIPVLYMIKNLNFTKEEKAKFRRQFIVFSGNGCFDENEFAKQNLIFDAVGLGTSEFSLSTRLYTHESTDKHLDAGIFLFLPTDWQFARGLYGTYIEPTDQAPILDLCDLVQGIPVSPVSNPNLGAILNDYFFDAVKHLSSDLLQCPLGYYQTMTIGLKLSPYWRIREDLEFNGLYTVEFLFPYEQKRFFDVKDGMASFSDIYNALPTGTDELEEAKLDFLEARLTELLFPRVFPTKLFPGLIITSASNIQKSYKSWDFTAGYSAWVQMAENFINVSVPKGTSIKDFDIDRSMSQDAYQIKIFGKAHHDIHAPRYDLSFTMWADFAIFNNNVGNDFTIGFSFDRKF